MKKLGFTLAEVLITLVIIGVVAAITVPAVNSHTKNEQFKTAAYKNTSVLNSAISKNYAFTSEKIDYYETPEDLKKNFFFKHFNIFDSETEVSNDWGEGIHSETSFYLSDGAKYGISEKITSDCKYDIRTKDENIPCYFIYVDTNGDKKPNRLTTDKNFYKDIITFYAYEDRFILWPEDFTKENNNNNNNNNNTNDDTNDDNTNDDNTNDDDTNDDDTNDDDDNKGSMEGCLQKRPPEECKKFCEKNGYHSKLCR